MTDDLPPTQYLVMEVLAARYRTGEVLWTFPSRLKPAMEALAQLGLIGWKSGIEALSIRAWLTEAGRAHSIKPDFLTPVQRALDQAASDMRSNYRSGDWSIEYINGWESAAAFAEGYASSEPGLRPSERSVAADRQMNREMQESMNADGEL